MSTVQPRPIDINVLPEKYRQGQVKTRVAVAVVVAAAMLFGLLPTLVVLGGARNQTERLETRLGRAEVQLDQAQVSRGQLEQLNGQIDQAREQLDQIRTGLGALNRSRPLRSDAIKAVIRSLAESVHIATITQQQDTFLLTADATSQADMLGYARALQSSGQFGNVRIVSVINTDPLTSEVRFSIEMEQ